MKKTLAKKEGKKCNYVGLWIGAQEGAIVAAKAAILEILKVQEAGDGSKTEALRTLAHLCEVKGVTVTNSTFYSK